MIRITNSTWHPILSSEGSRAEILGMNLNGDAWPSAFHCAKNGRRIATKIGSWIIVYDLDLSRYPTWQIVTSLVLDEKDGECLLSLTHDGRFLAVHTSSNHVHVWEIVDLYDSKDQKIKGKTRSLEDVQTLCHDGITSLDLKQVETSLYMAVSCKSYLYHRGRVEVFELPLNVLVNGTSSSTIWQSFLPSLKGRNAGDKFGSAIAILAAPEKDSNRVFRLVVSSPGYSFSQGLIQVFIAFKNQQGWIQQGRDVTGETMGEEFGASFDMSSGEQPFLIVGSPGWKSNRDLEQQGRAIDENGGGRGKVRLFHWRSPAFGYPYQWTSLEDARLEGENEGDELGAMVSITCNGERMAAASRVYVGIYERQAYDRVDEIPIERFELPVHGNYKSGSFGINDQGSVIVFVLSGGLPRSFLDVSPFCSVPGRDHHHQLHYLIERVSCRKNDSLIKDNETCSSSVIVGAGIESCNWVNMSVTDLSKDAQSDFPSYTPTPVSNPTILPVEFPSDSPSSIVSLMQSPSPSQTQTFGRSSNPGPTYITDSRMPTSGPTAGSHLRYTLGPSIPPSQPYETDEKHGGTSTRFVWATSVLPVILFLGALWIRNYCRRSEGPEKGKNAEPVSDMGYI